MVRRAALMPMIGLLIASGCGGKAQTLSGGTSTPSVSPSASTSPSTGGTDVSPSASDTTEESSRPDVLQLPDVAFFRLPCKANRDPSPGPTPHIALPDSAEMLQSFNICLFSFDPGQEIAASIQASDGAVVASDQPLADQDGAGTWDLLVYPEDPILPNQTYTVTASQGELAASPVPLVVTSTERRMVIKGPSSGPPGTTFSLALAGFDPAESVPLYLYPCTKVDPGRWTCTFLRDLSRVEMDENGQGLFSLPTSPEDAIGTYAVGFGTDDGVTYKLG